MDTRNILAICFLSVLAMGNVWVADPWEAGNVHSGWSLSETFEAGWGGFSDIYYTCENVSGVIGSKSTAFCYARYTGGPFGGTGSAGQNGSAVLVGVGNTILNSQVSLLLRADCIDFATSKHIQIGTRGGAAGGVIYRELTDTTVDHNVCFGCNNVLDVEAGDYLGYQWAGDGRNLVIRYWNLGDTFDPAASQDWRGWGTCAAGLYDQGAPPGCDLDVQVTMTAGYSSGSCFGISHWRNPNIADDGVDAVYLFDR